MSNDNNGYDIHNRGGSRPMMNPLHQQQWDIANGSFSQNQPNNAPQSAFGNFMTATFVLGVMVVLAGAFVLPALMTIRVPPWVVAVCHWGSFVVVGAAGGGFALVLTEWLAKARPRTSRARRRMSLLLSMSVCAIATWGAEVLLGGFSAFLRALAFADHHLTSGALHLLLIQQIPGLVLLALALRVGLGSPYRRAGGLLRIAIIAAFAVAAGSTGAILFGLVRAS